jgi:hypothetical protein
VSYAIELTIHEAGHFEAPIPMLVEDGGLRQVELSLTGEGVEKKGPTDALSES